MSVLTVGETMALFDPVGDGEPAYGDALTLRIAGAESNFAVALARLGVPVAWVSRVGDDPLGRMFAQLYRLYLAAKSSYRKMAG